MRLGYMVVFFLIQSCYVTQVAYDHQVLYWSKKPIAELLQDPNLPEKTRKKLEPVGPILSFARESGLNVENAYEYYIDMPDRDAVSYIVSAAEPHQLKSVTWWFPFVGTVPYKGFFQKNSRDELAEKLASQGYDIYLGDVDAFSSLGFFSDPIFEPMLDRSELSLAELLFHELAHRTIWVGNVDFNENLATFIGKELAVRYAEKKNIDEKYLKQQAIYNEDNRKFRQWLQALRKKLEEVYQRKALSKEQIIAEKEKIFQLFTHEKREKFEKYDFIGSEPWNNARILAQSLYLPDLERFEKTLGCVEKRSIKVFIPLLKKRLAVQSDPYKALDEVCHV